MKRLRMIALTLVLSTTGCTGSTTFVSSWRSPTAQPLRDKNVKVAAIVIMRDVTGRRIAEDKLASEITKRGGHGIPMYKLVNEANASGEESARASLEHAGVQGAIVMRPIGVELQPSQVDYSHSPYSTYWSGYYTYGWGSPWSDPSTQVYDTVVWVETLIYSLKQNQLVWAGQSNTVNPSSLNSLISDLATATAEELHRLSLVAGKT